MTPPAARRAAVIFMLVEDLPGGRRTILTGLACGTTGHVSASEQGQLQGINSSLMGLTGIFGPALFTFTFALFIGPYAGGRVPGAPFVLAAALLLAGFAIARRVTRRRPA